MNCNFETELELGERALFCTVYVEYDYQPGEPMVRYFKDGSGYPGSPATVEVCKVEVTTAEVGGETLTRDELAKIGGDGSWLKLLDQLAEAVIVDDCDDWGPICEDMLQLVEEREYEWED